MRAARLDNPDDKSLQRAELQLTAAVASRLFSEVSVGITTLGDDERALVSDLHGRIVARVESSDLFMPEADYLPRDIYESQHYPSRSNVYNRIQNDLHDPLPRLEGQVSKFWQDSRHAGQLLFHYTGVHDQIRKTRALMPRRMQATKSGGYVAANADKLDGRIWSPMVHWSEDYLGVSPLDPDAATIAMPLEDIIEHAAYGRDAHYGILEVKPERENEVMKRLANYYGTSLGDAKTGDYGQGLPGSNDRSFYSSPLDVGADAPISTAPDGHEFPLNSPDTFIITEGRQQAEISERYGRGEYFPTPYALMPEFDPYQSPLPSRDEQAAAISPRIEELQKRSIARRQGRIVVPLRSGVFDFSLSDEISRSHKPRPRFSEF